MKIKCFECNDLTLDPIEGFIYIKERKKFCSKECKDSCAEMEHHDMLKDIIFKSEIDRIKKTEYSRGYNECKIEMPELDKTQYNNGFLEGLREAIKISKICPRCKVNPIESLHHILPRKNGGGDNIENLIFLCFKCHDEVEIKTDEMLKEKNIGAEQLKHYIFNGFV